MLSPRLAERLLFFPPRVDPGNPPTLGPVGGRHVRGLDVQLRAGDGTRLHAWWFEASSGSPAVLFLHGNASHIGHLGFQAEGMLQEGVSVLLLSYRGYGRSSGRPTEVGVTLDAMAGFEWLVEKAGGERRVVVHGRSLGGAVTGALLEAGATPAGAILESAFTDLFAIARCVYPFLPRFLLGRIRGRFDTRAALAGSDLPVLILHGGADSIVPVRMARTLHEAAGARATLIEIPDASHNDLPAVAGSSYFERLGAFVRRVTGGDGA